jgi:sugar O-acyltransferase (sialic acid O-acetyltransferase NeuD family)
VLKNKKLILMGANNPQTLRLINDINNAQDKIKYEILGWIDNDKSKIGSDYFGFKVLGLPNILNDDLYKDVHLVNNITTDARVRYETTQQLLQYKQNFETLIHPSVNSSFVRIQTGSIIHENVILEAGVFIDEFAVISSGSIVCHESKIGKYSFISSGVKIAGLVEIQERVTILLGATILPRLTIEEDAIISAGSVVVEEIKKSSLVIGNPARAIAKTFIKTPPSQANSIEEELSFIFAQEFKTLLSIKKDEYFADYDLLSSFETFRLITLLEETFHITIESNEIDEENIGSFEKILLFISDKKIK